MDTELALVPTETEFKLTARELNLFYSSLATPAAQEAHRKYKDAGPSVKSLMQKIWIQARAEGLSGKALWKNLMGKVTRTSTQQSAVDKQSQVGYVSLATILTYHNIPVPVPGTEGFESAMQMGKALVDMKLIDPTLS